MGIRTESVDFTEQIRATLKDMLKVIKVVSMYPEDNPLPQTMKRRFAENLDQALDGVGDIELYVEKDKLSLGDETVFVDRSREESLAGLFFDAGVTTITFRAGLGPDEVYLLLDVIKEYINAPRHTFDLVNAIWEAGISHFVVTTVEDIALASYDDDFQVRELIEENTDRRRDRLGIEEVEGFESIFMDEDLVEQKSKPADGPSRLFANNAGEEASFKTDDAVQAMGLGDLPATAPLPDASVILSDEIRLSEEEELHIRDMLTEDAQFDLHESTSELVKELLHQEDDFSGFTETVGIAEKIVREFIGHCRLVEAGLLVDYMHSLEDRLTNEKPTWSQRLKDARITLGSHDNLKGLTEVLNENPDIGADELRRYFNNFGWEALSPVTEMLGSLEHRTHRDAACGFLATRGRDYIGIISRGIYDKRWFVVRNAVVILAHIGDEEALKHLRRAIDHEESRVRLELVRALRAIPSDSALEILTVAVRDSDYEIRQEAVNSIVARRGQAAFDAVTEIINDDSFDSLALDEQQMLLTAYSILGGEYAIDFLSKLIQQPNPFRNRSLSALRQAAFHALAHNRSEKCERFLVKLSGSWRPQLKRLAQETIRKRREVIYGGVDDNDN